MPLPGPKVGDYLKPTRDAYEREKLTVYKNFRALTGQPEPLATGQGGGKPAPPPPPPTDQPEPQPVEDAPTPKHTRSKGK